MAEIDFLTLTGLGAVPDARELRDAAMAADSTTLTTVGEAFAEEDVGKIIVVGAAGASGAKHVSTIAAFTSATEIELADAALAAVTDAGAVFGTDCGAALQAGLDALVEAKGGTLVVDGLFLLASPVSRDFDGETGGISAHISGNGTDSALWIGTADTADAITLMSGALEIRDLNFVGVPGATRDARRLFNLSALSLGLEDCGFYGLMAQDAIIYADLSSVETRGCTFGGSFVGPGPDYLNSVIENKNWAGYRDESSQFIDYGYFRALYYSKSGTGNNLAWIRADTANGSDGARGESVFRLRGTVLDEGSLHGVAVKPTTGTVAHVHLEGLRQNVTPAETGRGIHCQNVQSVVIERCWQGWASTSALVGHFQDCGTVLIDSLRLSDSVNKLSAANVTSLTLKDTTGITSFAFSNVNFHPVDSRYRDVSLVKDGAIADSDFVSPPAMGTLAFDRTNNRLYAKRLAGGGGWIYFNMSGGDTFGPELVVNGTFGLGTTGWTAGNSASLSVVSGALRVTNGAPYGRAYQAVPTVIGQQYQVSVTHVGGDAGYVIRVGSSQGSGNYAAFVHADGTASFTAGSTSTFITLMLDSETAGHYVDFDNASLRAM